MIGRRRERLAVQGRTLTTTAISRIIAAGVLLVAGSAGAEASARVNMRDAANGIRIATGKVLQKSGLFDEDSLQSLNGLCAHENYCVGDIGTITVQANGDVLRLYVNGASEPANYRQVCAAALAGLAPSRGLEQTTALVDAAFAVAALGTTSENNVDGVTFYVERLGSEPTQCSMVRR